MTQPLPHPRLQGLAQRLAQGRRRLQLKRLLAGSSLGLLLLCGGWLGLELLRWLGVLRFNPATLYFWLLGLGLLGLLGLLAYLLRTAPTLAQIARQADRHFALHERLSTALEVVQQSPKDHVHASIYSALADDAAAKAELVNPRELFGLRLPRPLLYALGAGLLAYGLQFAPTLAPKPAAQVPGLTPEEQAATLTQLSRLAQVIGRDAERNNDPYLQATVRSIERLKSDLQAGQLSAPMTQQEIARLSEQIEKGYGLNPAEEANTNPQSSAAGAAQPSQDTPNPPNPQGLKPGTQAPQSGPNPSQRLSNLSSRLEAKAQPSAQPPKPVPQTPSQQQSDCGDTPCSDIYAKAQAQRAKDAEAAKNQVKRPPGGAEGGFGDQAGKEGSGSQAGRPAGKLPPKPPAQQVKLPFQAPPSGRRIQVMAPPGTVTALAPGGEVQAQNWTRQEEVPIGLGYLQSQNRSIVSNYFTPKEKP